jgi:hypothetical protein
MGKNTRMDLKEIIVNTKDWKDSGQDKDDKSDTELPGCISPEVS